MDGVEPSHRFSMLDGYRAVAAVAVVCFHSLFLTGLSVRGSWFGNAVSRLDVAVTVFFLLSGFLLYRPWALAHLARDPGQRGPRTVGYLWHRALRILPGYWVVAVVALLTSARNGGLVQWVSVLSLTEVYRVRLPSGLEQTWSLSAEIVFYLLLPVFAAVLVRRRKRSPRRQLRVELVVLLGAAVVGLVCQGLAVSRLAWVPELSGSWLPSYLAWFGVGMAMAVIHAWITLYPGRLRATMTEIGASWGLCWSAAALLFVLDMTPVAGPTASLTLSPSEATCRNILYVLVAAAFLAPGVYGPQHEGVVVRLMAAPVMVYLGTISYGIFLWHLLLLKPVDRLTGHRLFEGGSPTVLAVTLVLSVGAAALSYHIVEAPALRLKRFGPSTRRDRRSRHTPSGQGLSPDDPDVGIGVVAQGRGTQPVADSAS